MVTKYPAEVTQRFTLMYSRGYSLCDMENVVTGALSHGDNSVVYSRFGSKEILG